MTGPLGATRAFPPATLRDLQAQVEAKRWPATPRLLFTARSGWQLVGTYDAATSNVSDQTDTFLGDRTAVVVGNGTPDQFFAFQKTGLKANAQGCNVRIWFKVGAVSTLGQLALYLGNDSGTTAFGASILNWVSATDSISNEIKPNEWTVLDIPWSAFTVTAGNPDRKRIDKIQLIGYTKTTGTPTTVKLGGVAFVPDDRPTWPKGVISLSFDDSDASQLVAKQYMDRFGFTGTLFPIIGALDTAGALTTQNVLDMAASGWEIGAHASTSAAHSTGLPAMSHADRMTELDTIKQWQLTNGVWSPTHAYPVGWLDTASAKDVAAAGYTCSRMASGFTYDTPRTPQRFRVRAQNASTGNANLMAAIKRVEANGGWLNIMFHRLVNASPTGNDAFHASLQSICDYAWAQKIPVVPIGQVVASARP